MHRATELQQTCLRRQEWLLRTWGTEAAAAAAQHRAATRRPQPEPGRDAQLRQPRMRPRLRPWLQPSAQSRPFSISRRLPRHEAGQPDAYADGTDSALAMETVVRQARATFGDTLPADYLNHEEYLLYQRLYGPPLRQTGPDDVGLHQATVEGQDLVDGNVAAARHALLRETESGLLEEVAYGTEPNHDAYSHRWSEVAGTELASGTDLAPAGPLTTAQVDYIQAVANNEREFDALTKLQRDFEVASRIATEQVIASEELVHGRVESKEAKEDIEDEVDEDEDDEQGGEDIDSDVRSGPNQRLHPLTIAGRSRTTPSTLQLPRAAFVEPISELLKRADIKHVRQAAQNVFGGPALPNSPATPKASARSGRPSFPQQPVAIEAGHHRMSEIDADAYIATALPGIYATAMSTLVEVRRRLGSDWIAGLLAKRDGSNPRILDVGGGGAALAAWNDVFRSELAVLRETGRLPAERSVGETAKAEEETTAPRKRMERTVVVGSDALRHRISRFLHNTTFLPRLPDLLHSAENVARHLDAPATPHPRANKRKTYDVIVASHLLLPLTRQHQRRALVANLWAQLNPDGGVLILLEKGHPRGFEAVADARQRILDDFFVPRPTLTAEVGHADNEAAATQPGKIIAPCTSHSKCPMYLTPGLTAGRKDYCHFSQRFIRPPYLQRILGQAHRNHEDIEYSYIAVQRGGQEPATDSEAAISAALGGRPSMSTTTTTTATETPADDAVEGEAIIDAIPNPLVLPRVVLPPLKRHGHVILDVCTPAGQIERWTVPKSFSKQAYHDARKARWGDLWALGAKTQIARPVRLGKKKQEVYE